jgi:hypothetical protein
VQPAQLHPASSRALLRGFMTGRRMPPHFFSAVAHCVGSVDSRRRAPGLCERLIAFPSGAYQAEESSSFRENRNILTFCSCGMAAVGPLAANTAPQVECFARIQSVPFRNRLVRLNSDLRYPAIRNSLAIQPLVALANGWHQSCTCESVTYPRTGEHKWIHYLKCCAAVATTGTVGVRQTGDTGMCE